MVRSNFHIRRFPLGCAGQLENSAKVAQVVAGAAVVVFAAKLTAVNFVAVLVFSVNFAVDFENFVYFVAY